MKFLDCKTFWEVIYKPILLFFCTMILSSLAYVIFKLDTAGMGDWFLVFTGLAFVYCLSSYICNYFDKKKSSNKVE